MNPSPMWLVYLTIAGLAIFLSREIFRKGNAVAVDSSHAVEAAKLLKDWGSWMTTVSTAVVGAVGVMLNSELASAVVSPIAPTTQPLARDAAWAYWTVALLLLSIVFAAWVLGSLPSIVTRLQKNETTPDNDIYEARLFSFLPVRLRAAAALEHAFFVLGLYCFALYVTRVPWSL